MAKKYLSVESGSNDFNDRINLKNSNNQINAQEVQSNVLKTEDKNHVLRDIKDIFINKQDLIELSNMTELDADGGDYTIDSIARKLNKLISALARVAQ